RDWWECAELRLKEEVDYQFHRGSERRVP
ncbi:hypothetical protein Tco_1516715, partial [Tanacetum coccineum]